MSSPTSLLLLALYSQQLISDRHSPVTGFQTRREKSELAVTKCCSPQTSVKAMQPTSAECDLSVIKLSPVYPSFFHLHHQLATNVSPLGEKLKQNGINLMY